MSSVLLGGGGGLAGAKIGAAIGAAGGPLGIAVGIGIGWLIGSTVGTVAGTYIDQNYLFPAIFPESTTGDTPLGLDRQIDVGVPGQPSFWPVGSGNRVPCQCIWAGPDRKLFGSSHGQTSLLEHRIDVAYGIAIDRGVPMSSIRGLFAEGKKILYGEGPQTAVSDKIWCSYAGLGPSPYAWMITLDSLPDGPDLREFRPSLTDYPITVTGFSSPIDGNNGDWRVGRVDKRSGGGTFMDLYSAIGVNNTGISVQGDYTVDLWQDLPPFSQEDFYSIAIYDGTQTTRDPLIEAVETAAFTPTYNGTAYFTLTQLECLQWGGRLPRIEAIVNFDVAINLGQAIDIILGRSALTPDQWDTSTLTDSFDGALVNGVSSPTRMLKTLTAVYDVVVQLRGDKKLHFVKRDSVDVINVDYDDQGAVQANRKPARPAVLKDVPEIQLPTKMVIQYYDSESSYQEQTTSEKRIKRVGQTEKVTNMNFAVSLTEAEAREVLRRKFWSDINSFREFQIPLPPSYLRVLEADKLKFREGNTEYTGVILEKNEGANWMIECRGVVTSQAAVDQKGTGHTPVPTKTNPGVASSSLVLADVPSVRDSENLLRGFYYAGCLTDPAQEFRGLGLYESVDGVDYRLATNIESEGVMGITERHNLLDANPAYWDDVSTVTVRLTNGQLTNSTDLEVMDGDNWIMIGNEVLGFVTADLVEENVYILRRLLRGLRGTEKEVDKHADSGEDVMLLDFNQVGFFDLLEGNIDHPRWYKAVPPNTAVADAVPFELTWRGNSRKPFAPVHVTAAYGTFIVNDVEFPGILITWVRRSRAHFRHFGRVNAPLVEREERYGVRVFKDTSSDEFYTYFVEGLDRIYIGEHHLNNPTGPNKFEIYQFPDTAGEGFTTGEITF